MFRVILGIIVSLFVISLLRMIVGAISREVGTTSKKAASGPPSSPMPAGGELRKCPTCGSYHALTSVAGRTKGGEIIHFCSLACRDKFAA